MRTVGALVFPGFELLDLYGPLEMLGLLKDRFELRLVAECSQAVPSAAGPRSHVDQTLDHASAFDILLVPGGFGTRQQVGNTIVLDWIRRQAVSAEIVSSVCTGAALLAAAGLLDGRAATTNKQSWSWATSFGRSVRWRPRARWVEDGRFFTSSGVSAGVDMTLAIIAGLHGQALARDVAIAAEYRWQADPSHDEFAEIHGLGPPVHAATERL